MNQPPSPPIMPRLTRTLTTYSNEDKLLMSNHFKHTRRYIIPDLVKQFDRRCIIHEEDLLNAQFTKNDFYWVAQAVSVTSCSPVNNIYIYIIEIDDRYNYDIIGYYSSDIVLIKEITHRICISSHPLTITKTVKPESILHITQPPPLQPSFFQCSIQ